MSDQLIQPIILAGGLGTRLRSRVADRPKALADIAGAPFLDRQIGWLQKFGYKHVTIAAGYKADQLQKYVEQYNAAHDVNLDIVIEDRPLGTGGAVANAICKCGWQCTLLVINGDTYFDFDLDAFIDWYRQQSGLAAVVAAKVDDVARYGTLQLEGESVIDFQQASGIKKDGYVSAGLTLLEPQTLSQEQRVTFSLEKDILPKLCRERRLNAFRVPTVNAFYDIGTPEAYDQFCQLMSSA